MHNLGSFAHAFHSSRVDGSSNIIVDRIVCCRHEESPCCHTVVSIIDTVLPPLDNPPSTRASVCMTWFRRERLVQESIPVPSSQVANGQRWVVGECGRFVAFSVGLTSPPTTKRFRSVLFVNFGFASFNEDRSGSTSPVSEPCRDPPEHWKNRNTSPCVFRSEQQNNQHNHTDKQLLCIKR